MTKVDIKIYLYIIFGSVFPKTIEPEIYAEMKQM